MPVHDETQLSCRCRREQLVTEKTVEQVDSQIAVPMSVVEVVNVQDPAGEQQ